MIIGAIIGDIVGSQYEGHKPSSINFPLFTSSCRATDDTVLTLAVADALDNNISFEENFRKFYNKYPNAGYGGMFIEWAQDPTKGPYMSYGNGAIMRISPVACLDTLEEVQLKADEATVCTHNHPIAMKAARTVASAIWYARNEKDPFEIITQMGWPIQEVPPHGYGFYSAYQTASLAFSVLYATKSFEEAIRLAVFLGGDTDTLAAVVGSIAYPMHNVETEIFSDAFKYLDEFQIDVLHNHFVRHKYPDLILTTQENG